jgi:hypothetical protein
MRRRRDTPRTDGGARREPAAEALERRYRWLLAWYPHVYRAANADDMLGVALARSASGQRWPEPGEAVNLIVSGIGERLGAMLRQPDQRDTAAVLAIAGPVLLAATAGRTIAGPFLFDPTISFPGVPPRMGVAAIACVTWWMLVALAGMLVALAGMLCWRRAAAAGACLGAAGQVTLLALVVSGYPGELMVSYWQAVVALVAAASALSSLRSQGRPLSWRAAAALAAAAAILAGWPAAEVAPVTYTRLTANSGTISDPLSGMEGWLTDGLFAVTLILMLATIAALRPAVRRRAVVLLLPAFVTTALASDGLDVAAGTIRSGSRSCRWMTQATAQLGGIIALIRVPLRTSPAYCWARMPNWSMASAVRCMRSLFTGPTGKSGSDMTAVTSGGRWSDFPMAARAVLGLFSASACPSSIARTNAAAVRGCCCAHARVATYPPIGKFRAAPWSRSASSTWP